MDFLPRPQHPLHPCPEITLLSLEQYDGEDFYTYPERQGWGPRTPRKWDECFTNPDRKFIAMVERWILFGYLCAFFGKDKVKKTNFVDWKGNPLYPILTMRELPKLYLKSDLTFLNNNKLLYAVALLNQRLIRTNMGTQIENGADSDIGLDEFIMEFVTKEVRSSYFSLLTSVIVEMGTDAIHQLTLQKPAIGRQFISFPVPNTNMLYTEFRLHGWCPADLVTVFERFNTSCFYFLLNIANPQPDVDHLDPLAVEATRTRQTVQTTPLVPNDPTGEEHVLRYGHKSQPGDEVRLCTPQVCKARVLDDATYKTKHATWDCQCDFVQADIPTLCEILREDAIPLIKSVDPDDENTGITLTAACPGTKYVAISHVWSDGLGNTSENAIPRCQLQRLSCYVQNITDKCGEYVYFWLDTICIPPDKICGCTCTPTKSCNPPCRGRELEAVQNISLGLMRQTYEDAEAVLVLDSWILETTCEGKSHVETLLRIFASPWTRRLWTYQEGFLAKVLHFQFLDCTLNLDDAVVELQENSDIIIRLTVLSPIMTGYWELRHNTQSHRVVRGRFWNMTPPLPVLTSEGLRSGEYTVRNDEGCWMGEVLEKVHGLKPIFSEDQPKLSDAEKLARRLITAASAVYHRSTSVITDEPLCLGAVLGLDVAKLAATEPEYRAQRFWQMFKVVPKRLLFLRGPKVDAPNYRWAPRSLLRTSQPALHSSHDKDSHISSWLDRNQKLIRRSDDGRLVLHTKGFILPLESKTICRSLWLLLPDGKTICSMNLEPSDASDPTIDFTNGIYPEEDYGCKELAILAESADWEYARPWSTNFILVAIQKTDNDGVYCRRICTVQLDTSFESELNGYEYITLVDMMEVVSLNFPGRCLDDDGVVMALAIEDVKILDWYVG